MKRKKQILVSGTPTIELKIFNGALKFLNNLYEEKYLRTVVDCFVVLRPFPFPKNTDNESLSSSLGRTAKHKSHELDVIIK